MFQNAHVWGISPTEFWDMTIPEWFALYSLHLPKVAGSLTQLEIDQIVEDNNLTDEEWKAKYGKPATD